MAERVSYKKIIRRRKMKTQKRMERIVLGIGLSLLLGASLLLPVSTGIDFAKAERYKYSKEKST